MVEPGADVTFDVVVTNDSVEPVTLYELTDSVYDDVADPANPKLVSTNCAVPATLTKPGSYSCAFTAFVAGNGATTHTNVVTARVRDNEGSTASNAGAANVGVTDAPPQVAVTKTPSATKVAAGTPVTYTYKVTNPGVEPLVVVTVADDKCSPVTFTSGDSDADGALDPGEEWVYSCTATLAATTVNTVSVVAEDDEGTGVLETATARVEVTEPEVPDDTAVLGVTIERSIPSVLGIDLPRTGAALLAWAATGTGFVTAGAGFLLVGRRRRRGPR